MLEGKISVSHYLNTKLRKKEVSQKESGYPVYLRLRFAGRQTEMKSNYYLFFETKEQPIHDALLDVGFEHMGYMSEKEFAKIEKDKGLKKAIERETIAVSEIIAFFARKKINIIDFDTKFIISKSLHTLELVVSDYAKHEMRDFLAKKHRELYGLFDWEAPFNYIFEGIQMLVDDGRNATKLKRDFLDKFQSHYELLVSLRAFMNPQIRIYQWQDGSDLKAEIISMLEAKNKNRSKDLITIMDHAGNRHFNFLKSTMDK